MEDLLFLQKPYHWQDLVRQFDWLKVMENCPQDAEYHAEGNVLIHTQMVVEELFKLPTWKSLHSEIQSILFASCLLHDVAKPLCTIIEEKGRITSGGHAKLGEKVSRKIMANVQKPFTFKEEICKLVRYHGLPLWFLEKYNPQKAVIQASLTCNTEWLAMVAEADVKGRICKDKDELLYKVELFREFCKENDCYGKPKRFANAHSRYTYFYKDGYSPDYPIFDDTHFEVYLMCGVPGSGKNTWIEKNLSHLPVVALDDIRKELDIDFTDNQGQVLQEAEERAKGFLRKKQSFVWNATNIIRQRRKKLIDLFSIYKARTTIVYMHKPLNKVLAQNRQREMMVKENIIERFFEKMEVPDLSEAHELIIVE